MILTVLILLPLVGALVTAFVPAAVARLVGLGFAAATLVAGIVVAVQYDAGDGMQLTETHTWIESLGVHYALGVDGLGLLMVLLTVVLVPIVLLAGWHESEAAGNSGAKAFFAWTLALEAMSLAVFTATDVLLFYVVFEATLIPAYFLIGGFGRAGRGRAATKFLIYQLAGGLIMLASVIGLYVVSANAGTPELPDQRPGRDRHRPRPRSAGCSSASSSPSRSRRRCSRSTPGWPTPPRRRPPAPRSCWSASSTRSARSACCGSASGCCPTPRSGRRRSSIVLALISIIYGALVAIGQDDVLRLIGLTSLSHFGFIVLGIFVFSSTGGSGAILYMVNHGIATALMFLVAGFLIRRTGTASIREMGGVEKTAPVLAGFFLVGGLAACRPARPVAVRLRDDRHHRRLRPPLAGRLGRGPRDRPRRVLRALDVPAHDDRSRADRWGAGGRPRPA